MKCLEHGQETNYLSIFDPKTLEYYDHFYKALAEHFGEKIDGVFDGSLSDRSRRAFHAG